jgi:2-dehydro-3-deoxygluconokinase
MTVPITILSIGECMGELSAAGDRLYRFGFAGDTLNTAWYLRALTSATQVAVDYLTAVGTDRLSDDLVRFLESHGLGTRPMLRIPDRTIGLYLISLSGAERSFTYWRDLSAARLLASDAVHLRTCLAGAACIYFSGITLAILSPEHRALLLAELARARDNGKTVAFDSNIRRILWRSDAEMIETLNAAYRVATIALPTFDDDRRVFGDTSAEACAARIAACGASEVVVKNGAAPCLVVTAGTTTWVTPEPVKDIVDTTGAGDSFSAGYLAARLTGGDPATAAARAHRVAGRVIGHRGALMDMRQLADLRCTAVGAD